MGRTPSQTSLSPGLRLYVSPSNCFFKVWLTISLKLIYAPSHDEAHPVTWNMGKLAFMTCNCLAAGLVIYSTDASGFTTRSPIRAFRAHKLAVQFTRALNIQFPSFLHAPYDRIVGNTCLSQWASLGSTITLSTVLKKMAKARGIPFPIDAFPSPFFYSVHVTRCSASLREILAASLLGALFALPIVRPSAL